MTIYSGIRGLAIPQCRRHPNKAHKYTLGRREVFDQVRGELQGPVQGANSGPSERSLARIHDFPFRQNATSKSGVGGGAFGSAQE